MTNTDTRDVEATLRQIAQLLAAGCEIVRLAVPDERAAEAFKQIKKRAHAPLIADIHFDHRLALAALRAGADGLRINPGNIGGRKAIEKIIREARARDVPHPNRGQCRVSSKGDSQKARSSESGSHGGERHGTHPSF